MIQPVNLSINLNKIALLRNQRDVGYPSVVEAGETILAAGAQGLTVHPRPDERHIRRSDVGEIAALVRRHPGIEFNVEGYPSEEFLDLVCRIQPDQVTLVPDDPHQATSDHGWDVVAQGGLLEPVIARLKQAGTRVSLFMDAEAAPMATVKALGADRIELYTGPYAWAYGGPDEAAQVEAYRRAARAAQQNGLGINAGHDLTLDNLPTFLAAVPDLLEVSIGHAFTSDALWMGLNGAIRAYLSALSSAGHRRCA